MSGITRQLSGPFVACVMVFGLLAAAPDGASAPSAASRVDVTETGGVYDVAASFAVSEMPHVVMAVLTDYERIPKFMPDMEVSKIVERTATGMVVEQQAVSKFMLFSKRVHLMLEVSATDGRIHFRDRCGESFSAYEGSWTISQHDTLTVVDYQLSAKPTFDVPAFVLKRLLKRDSIQMIDRIKLEIAGRADRAR